jgi:hypothetical protein
VLGLLPELPVNTLKLDLAAERGHSVAEAAVNRLFRSPQARERLAALVDVVELRAHELRENPLPPVGRQHADYRHPRGRHDRARHGELELEGARSTDDLPVLLCEMHALRPQDPLEAADVLLGGLAPEVVRDRRDPAAELVRLRLSDLHALRPSRAARIRASDAARSRRRRSGR